MRATTKTFKSKDKDENDVSQQMEVFELLPGQFLKVEPVMGSDGETSFLITINEFSRDLIRPIEARITKDILIDKILLFCSSPY